MTPETFIAKWKGSTRTERSASQEHFLDLCELLEVKKPQDEDPHGTFYTFEKSVLKLDGRPGRADVWRRGCFAWEYKGPQKSLQKALSQLKEYADSLENPPLLIVSDMQEIRVHTNFTNAVSVQHTIQWRDLMSVEARQLLRRCFTDPEKLRPTVTRETVTREAAKAFGAMAEKLRNQGYDGRRVAHFLNRLVFCLFAEDIELLPDRVFADILETTVTAADNFPAMLTNLFRAMKSRGGVFGSTAIPWFNGGLFDNDDVLPLDVVQIGELLRAARLDWSAIEPSIFGTLFEAGLNPEKREVMAALFDPAAARTKAAKAAAAGDKGVGIHYTDPATIMKIIEPVVLAPLRREWQVVKEQIVLHRTARHTAKTDAARTRAENAARKAWETFRQRLGRFRVLDPACGSGNFLYLALIHLKDFDRQVMKDGEALGLPLDKQRVGPDAVKGIEVNPYAAELARVTIWIGELQWQLRNSFDLRAEPILSRLDGIECRDALLNSDGAEAEWPDANVVVGNPPFLGGKWMLTELGEGYVGQLRAVYAGRVPAAADLVAYWFEKIRGLLVIDRIGAAGLVATNMIRSQVNRPIMNAIADRLCIFSAWSNEPWVVDGASVRVSLVCVSRGACHQINLDGREVVKIFADLSAGLDVTTANRLADNIGVAVRGIERGGAFDVSGNLAREWLCRPLNPNGRPNSDVLRPMMSGQDVMKCRPRDMWLIDFFPMDERAASLYEDVYSYIEKCVKTARADNREARTASKWWLHRRSGADVRAAIANIDRYIVTVLVSKHRVFLWVPKDVAPDTRLVVVARYDDACFGILSCKWHELWALRNSQDHGKGNTPVYTPSTTFETFPFPEGLTPNIPAAAYADDPRAQAIAVAAKRLDELRRNWLNPADLVKVVPEVVPGFPDRLLPVGAKAEAELKKRTLTNLYNQRPTWLDNAHRDLDAAVAAAYGWPADISDDDALARLLALNQSRAAAQGTLPAEEILPEIEDAE